MDNHSVEEKKKRRHQKIKFSNKGGEQVCILNPNAKDNHGLALLETDLDIDESKFDLLENQTPRAAGYLGKIPLVHTMLVYMRNSQGQIVCGKIDRHFSIITKCIYACGSEIGYIGDSKRETSHFELVMNWFLVTELNHRFNGLLSPPLVRLIRNCTLEEVLIWHKKWKGQIENAHQTMRSKLNVKIGVE